SEGPHQHVDLLARDQLFRDADRVARRAAVVPHHQLELPAAAIDLLDSELHAFAVWLEESGKDLVTIQLANPRGLARCDQRKKEQYQQDTNHLSPATLAPRSGRILSVPPGNARQNSLRTRLTMVALLFRP